MCFIGIKKTANYKSELKKYAKINGDTLIEIKKKKYCWIAAENSITKFYYQFEKNVRKTIY